ncbi:MAG: hypothetical protein U9R25_17490 [Chloroflexota bacterium]|nr:hypothetical protein [Chloroflexota bacterium]
MRVGRETFETDQAQRQKDAKGYAEGKGLIGGDPKRRPDHVRWRAIPEEQPYFRLIEISEGKRGRLDRFLDHRPLEIEVGFGSGEFMLGRASADPNRHFLGFEVKRHLCRGITRHVEQRGLNNLWISDDDARWALPQLNLLAKVDVIHVLYPDPWWKRKHRARRLFTEPVAALFHDQLGPDGILHIRSDVEGYARLIEEILAIHGGFTPNDPALARSFDADPATRREAFCQSINRPFRIMAFRKTTWSSLA